MQLICGPQEAPRKSVKLTTLHGEHLSYFLINQLVHVVELRESWYDTREI